MDKIANKNYWLNTLTIIASFFILSLYQKWCSNDVDLLKIFVLVFANFIAISLFVVLLYKLLFPHLLYKRKYLLFITISLIAIYFNSFIALKLHYVAYYLMGDMSAKTLKRLDNEYYLYFDIYLVLIVSYISIMTYKLFNDQWNIQNRYNLLQKENAQTELNMLKSQINPHFLFNSINTIYAAIDKNNAEARELVLKFSDMLRYQIYECNVDTISLDKEIKFILNYVELQKLRKNPNLIVVFNNNTETNVQIAPILFMPFVENAFKFVSNDITSNNNYIKISIITKNNVLHFSCINTVENIMSREIGDANGIGISNTERRLELLYNKKYKLKYGQENNEFVVNLEIELL